MAGELLAGGAIGAAAGELVKVMKHAIKGGIDFKSNLETARSEMEQMTMLVEQLDKLGGSLTNNGGNIDKLRELLNKGNEQIQKCEAVENNIILYLPKIPVYNHRLRNLVAQLHRASHHLALQMLLAIHVNQTNSTPMYLFIYNFILKIHKRFLSLLGIQDHPSAQPHLLPFILYDRRLLKAPNTTDRLMGVAVEHMDEENVFKKMIKGSTNDRYEKIFHSAFETEAEEAFKKWFRCYFNHNSCSLKGILYISTKKLAFCSKVRIQSGGRNELGCYLKVIIPFQLMKVEDSSSGMYSDECLKVTSVNQQEFSFQKIVNIKDLIKCMEELRNTSSTCN